jgi:hypothetical protein
VSEPALSLIFVADRYDTIRTTVQRALAQTALDRLEAVMVVPSLSDFAADQGELDMFPCCRVVEIGAIESLPRARAEGVRAATAPLVVLTESHSFPQPEWAQALIDAHQGPWAAVGPALVNGNPQTSMSWAALLIAYGRWSEWAPAEEIEDLPGHNSCYKRDLLLTYGDELPELMEMESRLHQDLRRRGHRLYFEPAAKTDHVNVSRPSSFIAVRFHSGRLFGAARAEAWGVRQRIVYALGAPLIPVVRLRRFVRDLRRPGAPSRLLPRVLPALVLGLVVSSFGELMGYAFGPGRSTHGREDIELHRELHV